MKLFAEMAERRGLTFTCWSGVGDGWVPLVEKMLDELAAAGWTETHIGQIKEKFATLRVYLDGLTEEQENIVEKYEAASGGICERCGKPGELRPRGWMVTLCDDCNGGSP